MSRCRLASAGAARLGLGAVVCGALMAALPGTASALTNFTWSGATTSIYWSSGGNWVGGAAPSGSVGTLTFPALPSCASPNTCYLSVDDQSGAQSVSATGLSVDDGVPYKISYRPGTSGITLGSGGITASPTSGSATGSPSLLVPITLSAPQTWSINGGTGGGRLTVGTVTGPQANTLAITFTSATAQPGPAAAFE